MKRSITTLILSALLLLTACSSAEDADIIITGNKIWTGNDDQPVAEALAIKGNRIISVGDYSEVRNYRVDETTIIDAGDGMVVPGFIDNHTHFNRAGELLMGINLLDVSDSELLRERVTETRGSSARRYVDDRWIVGSIRAVGDGRCRQQC